MTANIAYRRIQGVADASFGVVLPKQIVLRLGLEKGSFVKVEGMGDQIVIKKAEAE